MPLGYKAVRPVAGLMTFNVISTPERFPPSLLAVSTYVPTLTGVTCVPPSTKSIPVASPLFKVQIIWPVYSALTYLPATSIRAVSFLVVSLSFTDTVNVF